MLQIFTARCRWPLVFENYKNEIRNHTVIYIVEQILLKLSTQI